MSDDITSTVFRPKGADPLLLAGVNDANLLALQRALSVRVSLRGDTISVGGTSSRWSGRRRWCRGCST